MYTNTGLVQYAQKWRNYPTKYGWGCWGQPISDGIIRQKAAQYPSHYNASRQATLRNLINKGFLIDCVGLIKGYYWGQTPGAQSVKYSVASDVDANNMYVRAIEKGPIKTIPMIPGICVQMDGHIGISVGDGTIIESTRGSFGDGVVVTHLSDRPWLHWLKCPYIIYEEVNSLPEIVKPPTGDNPSSWAKESTKFMQSKGFMVGDGEGNFDWQGPITREAFAKVMHTILIAYGLESE